MCYQLISNSPPRTQDDKKCSIDDAICGKTRGPSKVYYDFASISATTTYTIVIGGVTMQYDQKIVRLINRSNASPDATWVIWASVRADGAESSNTLETTKTGLLDKDLVG